ncbi:MAX gene-associated protein isoform X2 [Sceloporus undulatus]|uniref:MAX gene-associated protein isoform X2 n=1 Tax=Sceloporus undulatus TaxID=8520 RepID=UPI001C4CAF1C|nr:MAX gene-associated protein isoform X2 [Sceloporus undulatus]
MENIGEISSVSKMEKQSVVLENQNGGTVAGAAPALYVLVKQSTGKSDQGALVSNQDDCGLASSAVQPVSKVKTTLPAERTLGSITVTLDNSNMWNEFYHRNTEMILTKQGRRMFPYCRYWISGLDSDLKYILVMDISPVDNFRYKWNGNSWEPSGKAEPHVLGRVFIHPESPSTGYYWMQQPVSFYKLKVTNNTLDQEGHIILHSMHRYLPRLHLVPADQATDVIQLNGPNVHTFTFPQTEFFAVTAYQNIQITQLKIDYNPFAKGFRDDGLSSRLQRDAKQNGSSEQEVGSLSSSPSNHKHPKEDDTLDPEQKALDRSFGDTCNTHLERDSLSPYHDFLGFIQTDVHGCNGQALKQETSESPIASQNVSHAASPLNSNGGVEVKEEPVDDYDYGPSVTVEGISVKQEDNDVAEEYLNSSDSVLERQLKKQNGMDKKESGSNKRPHDGQLGVARAKMLKLDNGKLPVVYLEPCAVTRSTVKVSALSPVVSPSKDEQSPLSRSVESFPTSFENSVISSPFEAKETDEIPTGKQIPEDNVSQRCSLVREMPWENNETSSNLASENKVPSCNVKTSAYSDPSLAKVKPTGKKSNALRNSISCKNITDNQNIGLPGQRKRGRPRKIKHPGVGRPPKCTGRLITTSNYASLEPHGIHLDVKPDLVDVDGVLFVSFASKEALDIHSVDRTEEKELKNTQTISLTTCDPCVDQGVQMIQQLEKELLEDLKSFKYRQEIHPSLREVGLKLNSVDPAMSIDLKYLGVQLPLSYSDHYASWKNLRGSSSSADTGVPFVSRTGKTNDFTKIKGWREKLHSSSKNEGIIIEGSLKNRSAFCSDKLDEYLETEGKLLETSMGLSPSTSSSPVVYQLPTKSTSYVRTLDSVLKKQSIITTSNSYNFKRLSVPSVSKRKRRKIKNRKQAILKSKEKSVPVVRKQKRNLPVLEEKVTSSQPSKQGANEAEALLAIEESMQGKQITVRQPQQQPQQISRLPSLSKTQLRLMDLEDCALWDGKPRTYITEERADLSLTTLLTAQASLKNKPIHKIMKSRAPPCNNEFCRLGCICSSLALEKRQPAHCRKPECMFGCTCLKRKVVLVKGGLKKKKILEKPLQGRQKLHCGEKLDQQEQDTEKEKEEDKLNGKDKKRKTKMEYTICDTEPEESVKHFPLWVKVDGELDPEPIYIPTPSAVEPTKPVMPPDPEVLPSDDKPSADEVKLATGVKPTRVYTPRPNPVIREEDKDPVYLYFESMMTCARVRTYTRKTQEKKHQQKCLPSSEKPIEKEHHPELQPIKTEEDKESGEKNCWFSCSAEDPAISYVHHTTPDGRTKLVEIVSDCSWEEDRNEILNTLSQHIKNKMPKSLKVGNYIIDLECEGKTWGEKNTPIYTSRVKISMQSCENQSEKDQITILETSDLSSCKKTEKNKSLTPGMLREQRKKGLPFYAGLSSAGKLFAYTCKSGLDPSSLIQVNGKNYPQAKLLLGQIGALHPASRLAAYLTGRLRPAMLDLSTISTVISKMASSTKVATSESQSAETPASETLKTIFLDNSTLNSTLTPPNAKANASAQRKIAIRPLLDGVTSQLVVSAVGALQQKIPGIRTPQPLTGPQKFNIRSTLSSGTATVPAAATTTITVASLPVTTPSPSQCTISPPSFPPGAEKRMGPRLLLIPVNSGSPTLRPQNMQLAQGKRMILQPIRNPGGVNLYRHPNGQIIQLVPLHQLQTTGSQPSLPPVILRNSGSVVGIRLPTPSKTPETSVCQSSPVSSVIQTTTATSVLSVTPTFSEYTTTETTSVLPETSTTIPTSLLPSTPTIEVPSMSLPLAVVSTPPNIEAASLLSIPCTSDMSLLPISPLPTSVPPTSKGLSVVTVPSISDVPLVLPIPPPTVSASSVTEAPSILPKQPTTEGPSVLSVPSTTDAPLLLPTTEAHSVLPEPTVESSVMPVSPASQGPTTLSRSAATQDSSGLSVPPVTDVPLVLAMPSSATPVLHSTEIPSTLSTSITNCTLKSITSMPICPVSATQAAPVISPAFVPVSQTGTLTLRICPSGIKSNTNHMSSDFKIKCSSSGQPNTTDNLNSLRSGSFALLQFPGKKNIPSPAVKQVASLESKNNEFSAIKLEENITNSQVVGTVEPKENKLPANQPELHAEELTCDQNGGTLERANKDAKITLQLVRGADISSDPTYISEDKKSEEEVMVKRKHVKNPEDTEGKVLYSCDTVPESCSETAALAHDTLEEEKVEQLKSSYEEQTDCNQAQNPDAGIEGAEQTQLDMEKRIIAEWPQESWNKHKVNIDSTKKVANKLKPLLWETQDPVPLGSNMNEKDNFVVAERKTEELREKTTSVEVQDNESSNKNLDNGQEFLPKINPDLQENDKTNRHIKEAADTQEESQTFRQLVALEYSTSIGADKHVEKFAKCIQQNTLKTSHHRKDSPPIIDITMDDTEKEEKTDDSADEMVDEISGYQSEDVVNLETMVSKVLN